MVFEIVATLLAGCAIGSYIGVTSARNHFKEEIAEEKLSAYEASMEADRWKRLYREKYEDYRKLKDYYYLYMKREDGKKSPEKEMPDRELLLEAARKAMFHSHPDHSRADTAEEFIKFKKLYDSLKK